VYSISKMMQKES